jgi:transcriptional regulator with XRE-family HTH domain
MIVKKLREQKNWSQDQLATMCGLSIRTIQRVESGQSASLETLKSLASVFEIEIKKLTEDITVIDKKAEDWKNLPLWFRFSLLTLHFELINLILGLVMWFIEPNHIFVPILFLTAYVAGWITRYGDKKDVWP